MTKLSTTISFAMALSGINIASAMADQVILDDLIVQNSACVGDNCQQDMDFGFSTLVLDQNDPSILFRDTSVSAAFPTTDWRIGTETSSGTFSIGNVSSGDTVFTISGNGNAIGLGAGSTLTDGTVSVGGLRVANAADGVADTDAVTLRQLNAAIALIPTDLAAASAALANANQRNAKDLRQLSGEIDAVGAIGSAMSALQMNPRASGDHFLAFGLGHYEGTSAVAVGSFHYFANNSVFVNTGVSATTNGDGGTAARLGVTFGR